MRKPISKKLRFDVFKRDGFKCMYCGAHPPGVLLHVDHIMSVKDGGKNNFDNLVTACVACNLGKGATALSVVPESLQSKAEAVREREAQLAGYAEVMEEKLERIEAELWRVAEVLKPGCSKSGLNRDICQSIRKFNESLGLYVCLEAADAARAKFQYGGNKTIRYFFGICWNISREKKAD